MIKDALNDLNIRFDGEFSRDGSYVVDLFDSDQFGKVYSILDKNKDVESMEDSSSLTVHSANISYLYGDYQLNLIADFDENLYKLVITEYEYVEDEYVEDEFEEESENDDERDN